MDILPDGNVVFKSKPRPLPGLSVSAPSHESPGGGGPAASTTVYSSDTIAEFARDLLPISGGSRRRPRIPDRDSSSPSSRRTRTSTPGSGVAGVAGGGRGSGSGSGPGPGPVGGDEEGDDDDEDDDDDEEKEDEEEDGGHMSKMNMFDLHNKLSAYNSRPSYGMYDVDGGRRRVVTGHILSPPSSLNLSSDGSTAPRYYAVNLVTAPPPLEFKPRVVVDMSGAREIHGMSRGLKKSHDRDTTNQEGYSFMKQANGSKRKKFDNTKLTGRSKSKNSLVSMTGMGIMMDPGSDKTPEQILKDHNKAFRMKARYNIRQAAEQAGMLQTVVWDSPPSWSPFVIYTLLVSNTNYVIAVLGIVNLFEWMDGVRVSTVYKTLETYAGIPKSYFKAVLFLGDDSSKMGKLNIKRARAAMISKSNGLLTPEDLWVLDNVEFDSRSLLTSTWFSARAFIRKAKEEILDDARKQYDPALQISIDEHIERSTMRSNFFHFVGKFDSSPFSFVLRDPSDVLRVRSSFFRSAEFVNKDKGLVEGSQVLIGMLSQITIDEMYRAMHDKGETAVIVPAYCAFKYRVLEGEGFVVNCGARGADKIVYALSCVWKIESSIASIVAEMVEGSRHGLSAPVLRTSRIVTWTVAIQKRSPEVVCEWISSGVAPGSGILEEEGGFIHSMEEKDIVLFCPRAVVERTCRALLGPRRIRTVFVPCGPPPPGEPPEHRESVRKAISEASLVVCVSAEIMDIHQTHLVLSSCSKECCVVMVGCMQIHPSCERMGSPFFDMCSCVSIPSHSTEDTIPRDAHDRIKVAYAGLGILAGQTALLDIAKPLPPKSTLGAESGDVIPGEDMTRPFHMYSCTDLDSAMDAICGLFSMNGGGFVDRSKVDLDNLAEGEDFRLATYPRVLVIKGHSSMRSYEDKLQEFTSKWARAERSEWRGAERTHGPEPDHGSTTGGASRVPKNAPLTLGSRVLLCKRKDPAVVVEIFKEIEKGRCVATPRARWNDTSVVVRVAPLGPSPSGTLQVFYNGGVKLSEACAVEDYEGCAFDWVVFLFDPEYHISCEAFVTAVQRFPRKGVLLVGEKDVVLGNLASSSPRKATALQELIHETIISMRADRSGPS